MPDLTLQQSVDQFKEDQERVRKFVNEEGGYVAEDGTPVKSLRDFNVTLEGYEGQALTFRNEAEGFANDSQNSATSSGNSSTSAAASAAAALAAAEASGNVVFYDTYALADAAVAGLSDLQIVQVLADETMQGQRTLYRKEGGVLVFKIALSELRALYVDSNIGNDANAGTDPEAPLATIGAALTPFNAVKNCTLYLGRGSQFFERDLFILGKYGKVLPFGQGLDPVIDAAYTATGTWTNDGTYTNLWYIDVTFDNATFGNASNLSSAWHPALYDEAEDSRVDECGVQRVLNGDVVGGSTVAAAAIADLLTIANAAPGRFTVHRTGSTNVEPRSDNGTQFRFYLYPADGSNPNTNGRTVRVVGQEAVISQLGEGVVIDEITLQRCGGKDMMGTVTSNPIKAGKIQRSTFLEAAVHAMVMGGVKVEKCKAKSAYHRDSRRDAGGAFHQFRGQNGDGTSKGVNFLDVEAEGFGYALYSHGIPGPETDEQTVFDADVVRAKDCNALYSCDSPTKGVRLKRIHATGLDSIGNLVAKGGVVIEDSEIFLADPPPAGSFMFQAFGVSFIIGEGANATFKNSLVVSKSTGLVDSLLIPGGATVDEYPIIELIDSTVIANILDPGNALRNRQSWVLQNSVLTSIGSLFLSGNLTADATSSLEFSDLVVEDVIADFPDVDPAVLTGVRRQVYTQTIELSDLDFVSKAGRVATYSGTPNGDGTADLTINFNDASYGRAIRILDAYGSGLHYVGRIVDAGVPGPGDIIVSPEPTGAFTDKQLQVGYYNKSIYRDPIMASLATDGESASVPDGTMFTEGMTIVVAKPYGRGSYGVRQVADITGNVITFDVPCEWFRNVANAASQYNTVDGSITGRLELPEVEITFGFPLKQRTTAGEDHPSVSVELVEGGTAVSKQTTNLPGFSGDVRSDFDTSGNETPGGTYLIGLHNEEGYFDNGFSVGIDDVMTVIADAFVDQDKLILLSDPLTSGAYIVDPLCGPAKRKSGYQAGASK